MEHPSLNEYLETLHGWSACPICKREWADLGVWPGFGNFLILETLAGPPRCPRFEWLLICDECYAVVATCADCRHETGTGECMLRPPPKSPDAVGPEYQPTFSQPSYGPRGACASWMQARPVSYAWQAQIAEEIRR